MFRFVVYLVMLCISFFTWANSSAPLIVYTYSSFISEWGPGAELKALFEKEYHHKIEFVATGDGVALLNRLRLEGSRSRADVVLGLDNNLIVAAKKANLIQPHRLKPFSKMQIKWWDKYFIPYDFGYFAFVYNKKQIPDPPHSFDELLNWPQPLKIVYADPRTTTTGLGLVTWIEAIYGHNAARVWKKLAQKTLTVTSSWSEAYTLMLQKEADMVLSYDTSPVAHRLNENNFNYDFALFKEGHYKQVEIAGITKTTHNFALAQQFLQFLGSAKAQRLLATHNIMHPVVKIALPPAFMSLKPITKSLDIAPQVVDAKRKEWISLWQNAVSQ